jgi:isopentenyl phosphate kinase
MWKLFYTRNMQPVLTGDVVHFANRSWTIMEIDESTSYLSTKVWVRSNDEQHLMISANPADFMARFVQTK